MKYQSGYYIDSVELELTGKMKKFLQSLDNGVYSQLDKLAKKRGVNIQELLRAVIIPEWLEDKKGLSLGFGKGDYSALTGKKNK